MRVASVEPADHPALAAMRYDFRAAFDPPNEPREQFEARMVGWLGQHLGRDWIAWVARDSDELLGHVFVHIVDKVPNPVPEPEQLGYLTNLYVRDDLRGGGIGAALLDAALAECRMRGLDTVVLWATQRSRSLYERHGFGVPEDAMELPLTDHPRRRQIDG
jgi:GNAT superfamily N-acetyltransferase